MKNINDLLVEFRAVYSTGLGKETRRLEWRISPNQDIRYYKEYSWFWGLIKFGTVKKYDTGWNLVTAFRNSTSSYLFPESHSEDCIFYVNSKSEFSWWKANIKTYGELRSYLNKRNDEERNKYRAERLRYLNSIKTWE